MKRNILKIVLSACLSLLLIGGWDRPESVEKKAEGDIPSASVRKANTEDNEEGRITLDRERFESYKLWRKTHRLARGMKATFLCKTACPLLGICID